jgi:hypothetical protein
MLCYKIIMNEINYDEEISKIYEEKKVNLNLVKKLEEDVYLKELINKNKLALALYHNNMYRYSSYNTTCEIKIDNTYNKYYYDDETVKNIIDIINACNHKKLLIQPQNIITDLKNKFIVIYLSCYLPILDMCNNFESIIYYKHDFIRLCFQNQNIYMACCTYDVNGNVELEMDFGNSYFEYYLDEITVLQPDYKFINSKDEIYYMFDIKDFYDAISIY